MPLQGYAGDAAHKAIQALAADIHLKGWRHMQQQQQLWHWWWYVENNLWGRWEGLWLCVEEGTATWGTMTCLCSVIWLPALNWVLFVQHDLTACSKTDISLCSMTVTWHVAQLALCTRGDVTPCAVGDHSVGKLTRVAQEPARVQRAAPTLCLGDADCWMRKFVLY